MATNNEWKNSLSQPLTDSEWRRIRRQPPLQPQPQQEPYQKALNEVTEVAQDAYSALAWFGWYIILVIALAIGITSIFYTDHQAPVWVSFIIFGAPFFALVAFANRRR